MKLRNKFIAGFAAIVLVLSMMVGTAMAATIDSIDNATAAKEATKDKWWVKLVDGAACDGAVVAYYPGMADVANKVASIDFVVNGNCTIEYHVIYQGAYSPDGSGYDNTTLKAVPATVDGVTVISADYDGSVIDGTVGTAVAFLARNKSEGAFALEAYILRDADKNIIAGVDGTGFLAAADAKSLFNELTGVVEEAAPAEEVATDDAVATDDTTDAAVPQTGVVSFALLFGLGAATLGTGSVILKKKER